MSSRRDPWQGRASGTLRWADATPEGAPRSGWTAAGLGLVVAGIALGWKAVGHDGAGAALLFAGGALALTGGGLLVALTAARGRPLAAAGFLAVVGGFVLAVLPQVLGQGAHTVLGWYGPLLGVLVLLPLGVVGVAVAALFSLLAPRRKPPD